MVSHASLHQNAMHPTHQNSISVFLCACLCLYLSRKWFLYCFIRLVYSKQVCTHHQNSVCVCVCVIHTHNHYHHPHQSSASFSVCVCLSVSVFNGFMVIYELDWNACSVATITYLPHFIYQISKCLLGRAHEARSVADCRARRGSARDLPENLAGRKSRISALPHPADVCLPLLLPFWPARELRRSAHRSASRSPA